MDNRQPQEIDLLKLAFVLLNKLWLIVLVTVAAAVLTFAYTVLFIHPEYEAESKLYVFNSSDKMLTGQVSSSDISTSKILVNTYIVILESDSVLSQVCDLISEYQGQEGYEYLGTEEYTPARIKKMLSASSINNTESFRVVIRARDPYEATFINDAILYFLPDEIIRVVKAGAVEIIDNASVPQEPCSPSIMKNTVLGGLVGFVLICAIIVVLSLLDSRIHNEDDLTEEFKDIPIIGTIPSFDAHSRKGGGKERAGKGSAKSLPKAEKSAPKAKKSAEEDDDDWEDE